MRGQRWVSETEPELGLGTVLGAAEGRVHIYFGAADEHRQYAEGSAPLRRVVFRKGDRITPREGPAGVVAAVESRGGLHVYRTTEGAIVPEAELSDHLSFGSPDSRLMSGRVDPGRVFSLRRAALEHQHRRRKSPVRGFVGGRMDLIRHQLGIAQEVTSRLAPRVLLADEVGLGKTVEACLIIHRLLGTGRVSRVMVVVPEPLVHQWFVELLRRFNLWFHIFDEERCDSIEAGDPEANPFLEDQLVLCGLPLLLDPRRAAQARDAGWDLLVVDEAHHLGWSPGGASPEYTAIEALSRVAEGLLLLTATPEQLGLAGHFARLRLLDPDRYPDFEEFKRESARYGEVAAVAGRLEKGAALSEEDERILGELFRDAGFSARLRAVRSGEPGAREELLADLLDRHGTGRVMFRNTRAAMKGFPRRLPQPARLDGPHEAGLGDALAREFEADLAAGAASGVGASPPLTRADPRIPWLVDLLRRLGEGKVLLIARTQAKVLAIEEALRERIAVKTALFHEGLPLVQRDRNAAWFADPDGARILLASEIGSEGRNFQFAHDLVLFDLPLDPELVEQRIGRLDRIGQTTDIRIHVPYVPNTAHEVLFRWFHEGLDAFGHNLVGGRELLERFGAEVRDLAQDYHETHAARKRELDDLVERTRAARVELEHRLEAGRDRLLELNSHRPAAARQVIEGIQALDEERALEDFLLRAWDHYGVTVEDRGPRTYRVGSEGVFADSFPGLPKEGFVGTLDRRTALSREDLVFLTWDHPMVTGALDLLLGSAEGTSAMVAWPDARERGLWLETIHVLECVAPPKLHADRFLPATPIRCVVDVRGQDVTAAAERVLDQGAPLEDVPAHDLIERLHAVLPELVDSAHELAETRARPVIRTAKTEVSRQLGKEQERLKSLAAVNPAVRPEEIAALRRHEEALLGAIDGARLRLDAVRVILLGRW